MAARKHVSLTMEHARRVADGEATLSELAAELGIARQSLHTTFRRKLWPTTPVAAMPSPASTVPSAGPPAPGSPAMAPKGRRKPTNARSASPASSLPAAPIGAPSDPAAPATVEIRTSDEMVEHARRAIAAVALATLDRAHEVLSKPPIGAQSIRACIAAGALAIDQLARAGFDIATAGEAQAPRMVIAEMTASECEAARAAAEVEHNESFGSILDDAELAEEEHDDEADPRHRAA